MLVLKKKKKQWCVGSDDIDLCEEWDSGIWSLERLIHISRLPRWDLVDSSLIINVDAQLGKSHSDRLSYDIICLAQMTAMQKFANKVTRERKDPRLPKILRGTRGIKNLLDCWK